jgi:hypothetical protein
MDWEARHKCERSALIHVHLQTFRVTDHRLGYLDACGRGLTGGEGNRGSPS